MTCMNTDQNVLTDQLTSSIFGFSDGISQVLESIFWIDFGKLHLQTYCS